MDDRVAVVVDHLGIHVDATGGQHDRLGAAEVDVRAVLGGRHDAVDTPVGILHELLGAGVEVVDGRDVVLLGVLGVNVEHGRGLEVAGLLGEGDRGIHGVELVVREALGNDGVGRIGAERVGLDAVLGALVDKPVAGLAGAVEPHGDERLLDAARAGADPAVLGLVDVHRKVLADLLAILLGELRVAEADAATAALNGAQLLEHDDRKAVVDAGGGSRAAGVAGADHDDVGLLGGGAVGLGQRSGSGEERRGLLGIAGAGAVDATLRALGGELHVLGRAGATGQRHRRGAGGCGQRPHGGRPCDEAATRDTVCHSVRSFLTVVCRPVPPGVQRAEGPAAPSRPIHIGANSSRRGAAPP